jgi:hypothetical protein
MIVPVPLVTVAERLLQRGLIKVAFKIWRAERARGVTALNADLLKSKIRQRVEYETVKFLKDNIRPEDPKSGFKRASDAIVESLTPHILDEITSDHRVRAKR